MNRVPVTIRRSSLVPNGFSAWVPLKRVILIAPHTIITERLIAHELAHCVQAETAAWPLAYVLQWVRVGLNYYRMPYERAARRAEQEPYYLTWAAEVIREHKL